MLRIEKVSENYFTHQLSNSAYSMVNKLLKEKFDNLLEVIIFLFTLEDTNNSATNEKNTTTFPTLHTLKTINQSKGEKTLQ